MPSSLTSSWSCIPYASKDVSLHRRKRRIPNLRNRNTSSTRSNSFSLHLAALLGDIQLLSEILLHHYDHFSKVNERDNVR